MNVLVDSIKRLYKNGQITTEKINELLKTNKITQDEYMYILN